MEFGGSVSIKIPEKKPYERGGSSIKWVILGIATLNELTLHSQNYKIMTWSPSTTLFLPLKRKNDAMTQKYGLLCHYFNIFQKTATSLTKKQFGKATW